jgi:indole-3-glycerol phosphate synthase
MNSTLKNIIDSVRETEKSNFNNFSFSNIKLRERKKPIDVIPLLQKEFFIITEVKKASPSKGIIREDFDPVDIAISYEKGGASAVSVLTENKFFSGSKDNLLQIRNNVNLPILRKDFIIHPFQIYESYNLGADFILLIAACLNDSELKNLYDISVSLGMNALIEVHDRNELERILKIDPLIIGINNRDLNNFKIDINTSFVLKKLIPENIHVISESGIQSHDDIVTLKTANFSGALVGESLLKECNLIEATKRLIYG